MVIKILCMFGYNCSTFVSLLMFTGLVVDKKDDCQTLISNNSSGWLKKIIEHLVFA